jgi:hypothetical protein
MHRFFYIAEANIENKIYESGGNCNGENLGNILGIRKSY